MIGDPIALGIGTPSSIPVFLLVGLSPTGPIVFEPHVVEAFASYAGSVDAFGRYQASVDAFGIFDESVDAFASED